MGNIKCPRCGSMNTTKTAGGYATDVASIAAGIGVWSAASAVKTLLHVPNSHTKEFTMVFNASSRDYKCKKCGRTFYYKEK